MIPFITCKRCGERLPASEYRRLRLQYRGVCRLCELKEDVACEERAREKRKESMYDLVRINRLRVLPDDE